MKKISADVVVLGAGVGGYTAAFYAADRGRQVLLIEQESVLGGVNYGRDCDSIATMAGAITGALGGLAAVPTEWVSQVGEASRTDIVAPGHTMASVARDIWKKDAERDRRRADARSALQ